MIPSLSAALHLYSTPDTIHIARYTRTETSLCAKSPSTLAAVMFLHAAVTSPVGNDLNTSGGDETGLSCCECGRFRRFYIATTRFHRTHTHTHLLPATAAVARPFSRVLFFLHLFFLGHRLPSSVVCRLSSVAQLRRPASTVYTPAVVRRS
jgi:hypothetical protein